MHVLEILRQLAEGGRAIVTTIHQPSSRLFQTLDKLLLLSQVLNYSIWQNNIFSIIDPRISCQEARFVCRGAACKAAKILPLMKLARSQQDLVKRGHGAQHFYRLAFIPPGKSCNSFICRSYQIL